MSAEHSPDDEDFVQDVSLAVALVGRIGLMFPEIIQLAVDLDDRTLFDLFDPEEPVSGITHVPVFGADVFQTPFPPEQYHAGIVDRVAVEHARYQIVAGVIEAYLSVLLPGIVSDFPGDDSAFAVDDMRTGGAEPCFGVFLHLLDRGPEKVGIGQVVAFGDPDVASASELDSFFPLLEGASAVAFVQYDVTDGGVVLILFQDIRAVVRRTVVQQNEFEVRVRLREDRVDALAYVFAVVVVGDDDGDNGLFFRIPAWRGVTLCSHVFSNDFQFVGSDVWALLKYALLRKGVRRSASGGGE